jgi:hypothetical protein
LSRVLIPRSDSISAKIIEPSDFENLFTSDIVQDYIKSGFTLSAGSGLACNVSTGVIRFKGLYLENDTIEAVGSLTASTTNSIHVKLNRDGNSEVESWSFSLSSSGETMLLGQAITDGSGVTSVTTTNRATSKPSLFALNTALGGGTAGDVLYSNGTNWTKLAKGSDGQYLKLVSGVPAWVSLANQVTHQTGELNGGTSNTWAKLGTHGSSGTLTVATRANGKFLCILNMNITHGAGSYPANFEIRVNGTKVDEWTRPPAKDTDNDNTQTKIVTLSGPLDGRTIEIWGFHIYSTHPYVNSGALIDNQAASGGSTYSIWEWSEL